MNIYKIDFYEEFLLYNFEDFKLRSVLNIGDMSMNITPKDRINVGFFFHIMIFATRTVVDLKQRIFEHSIYIHRCEFYH